MSRDGSFCTELCDGGRQGKSAVSTPHLPLDNRQPVRKLHTVRSRQAISAQTHLPLELGNAEPR